MLPLHQGPALFPYTTLFRSRRRLRIGGEGSGGGGRGADFAQRLATAASAFAVGGSEGIAALRRKEWRKGPAAQHFAEDRKSTRLNSSHTVISYAVFCLKKKS